MALNLSVFNIPDALDIIQDRQAFELHKSGWRCENVLGETAWLHPVLSSGVWVALSTASGLNRGGLQCLSL